MPADLPVATRAEEKQKRILDAASELFLERGYDAVSLDDVLERAGGSKTTLYSYYGGKEGLFAAIVQKACHDKLAPLLELDVKDLDPNTGLKALGQKFLSVIANPTGRCLYRMMVAEAERFPELAGAFYSAGPQAAITLLRRTLEHWQKKGLLRESNPEVLAIQFIGIMLGNFSLKSLLGLSSALSQKEIEDWTTHGVTLFLKGALAREGNSNETGISVR